MARKRENITLFFITTALFNILIDVNVGCLAQVRKVLFGGERVSVNHVKKALEFIKNDTMIHVYGPTESTVFATYCEVNEINNSGTIPIGRPISNTQVFIVNRNHQLQPIGTLGEICIAGDGLAQNYLNLPELTYEKFVEHPFRDGEKMYKTGDLGRWLSDGTIEYFGRTDYQVKIRGFRVELGEIEAVLLSMDGIQEGVLVARENEQGQKFLCAYIYKLN